MNALRHTFATLLVLAIATAAPAAEDCVMEFDHDQAGWEAAVGGEFTTIDFTDAKHAGFITDQYGDLGVHFNTPVLGFNTCQLYDDCWGATGPFGISVTFDEPQHAIAFEVGVIELWNDGELIYTSSNLIASFGHPDKFAGVVSSVPFDEAYLYATFGQGSIWIDDLHFSATAASGEPQECDPPPGGDFDAEFTDKDEWIAATGGAFSTITFTEVKGTGQGPGIGGFYMGDHGVIFAGFDTFFAITGDWMPFELFVNDGVGAMYDPILLPDEGEQAAMMIFFNEPQNAFAIDHPWVARIEFRMTGGGGIIGESSLSGSHSTVGNFIGIISDEPFDWVNIYRPNLAFVLIDDMHFGFVPPDLPGDLTGDGTVGVDDLLILLAAWGDCPDCDACPADLTGDCAVGVDDLLILLANWG